MKKMLMFTLNLTNYKHKVLKLFVLVLTGGTTKIAKFVDDLVLLVGL